MKSFVAVLAVAALLGFAHCQTFSASQLPFLALAPLILNEAITPVPPIPPFPGAAAAGPVPFNPFAFGTQFPSAQFAPAPAPIPYGFPQAFPAPALQPISVPVPNIVRSVVKGGAQVVPIVAQHGLEGSY